jgi:hypothetical protein
MCVSTGRLKCVHESVRNAYHTLQLLPYSMSQLLPNVDLWGRCSINTGDMRMTISHLYTRALITVIVLAYVASAKYGHRTGKEAFPEMELGSTSRVSDFVSMQLKRRKVATVGLSWRAQDHDLALCWLRKNTSWQLGMKLTCATVKEQLIGRGCFHLLLAFVSGLARTI